MTNTMTRRAVLVGLGTTAASAAVAVPYVNAAQLSAPIESVTGRIDRLAEELSAAMAEYHDGGWLIQVGAGNEVSLLPRGISPETRIRKAVAQIRRAMNDDGQSDYMVFVKDKPGENVAKVIDFNSDITRDIA